MSATVTINTTGDRDFVRTLAYVQRFGAWNGSTYYTAGTKSEFAGQAWNAVVDSLGVSPGSDNTKWQVTTRTPVDLTGSTLHLSVRRTPASVDAVVDVSTANGGIVILSPATAGRFTMTFPFASLSNMPAGNYVLSLIRTRPDGLRELIMSGVLVHGGGVTR